MKTECIKLITAIKSNTILRKILKPIANINKKVKLNQYQASDYSVEIKRFCNINYGKRCFIIGNGPSLTIRDLEKICGEYCFGANRIYSLFDQTKWRPTYYTCVDKEAYKAFSDEIVKIDAEAIFLEYTGKNYFKKYLKRKKNNLFFIVHYEPFKTAKWALSEPFISTDVSKVVSASNTVTFVNIQLAIYMGFKEIYLIGVDHQYAKQINKDGQISQNDNIQTYAKGIIDTGVGIQYIDATTNAYEIANEYCKGHDIRIYNATRGGKLEVFERVDFDTLFLNNEEEK